MNSNIVGLVNLEKVDDAFIIDAKYSTKDNFVGIKLYPENKLFILKNVAQRLKRVQSRLKEKGLRLKILDAYRPLVVQKKLWELVPDERYVSNPEKGSKHNRGCAVDLTLADTMGNELTMPTRFDDFIERAHRNYQKLPTKVLKNRQVLEDTMNAEGFLPFPTEWWHFDDPDWSKHPILDINPYNQPLFPK